MQNNKNKSKKFVVLATYVVAVLCLLAGLFLPLFNGKEVLALKLADAFKCLMKKDNSFSLSYPIALFGIQKMKFDFMALVIVLYAAVTALSVLSFVPVALSVRKKGKLAKKFYFGIEIAALIVLALYFVSVGYMYSFTASLPPEFESSVKTIGYNMVIAACGTAVALVVMSGLYKKNKPAIKIVLFILSTLAFLGLFDFVVLLAKQEAFAKFTSKISSGLVGGSGIDYLTLLFANKISNTLKFMETMKEKALLVLAAVTATAVLLNFFIDMIKLATRPDKKGGRLFDIVRFGLEVALAVSVLVTALICKVDLGLMLIIILAVAAVELAIAILRFVKCVLKNTKQAAYDDEEVAVEDTEAYRAAEPLLLDNPNVTDIVDEPVTEEQVSEEVVADETDEPAEAVEPVEAEPTTPIPPVPDDDGYVDPELDAQYQQLIEEQKAEAREETPEIYDDEDLEDVELYEPESGTTYLVPDSDTEAEEAAEEVEETESEPVEEAAEEVEETESEPAEEPVEEPIEAVEVESEAVEEVTEEAVEPEVEEPVEAAEVESEAAEEITEEAEEPVEAAEVESEAVEETAEEAVEPEAEDVEAAQEAVEEAKEPAAQNPFREVKPYNPYERHNNPFRAFEDQPYNPYRQQEPVQFEKPAPRPTYEPKVQPKQYEQPERVKPLQPRPIIQEFKPVPPVSEQPQRDHRVYTIDTLYAGPVDDFIRKLSNDERIEFAKTFLEKNRGNLGSIPDYVVGGDNKKFFSTAFIYLGRIRGMVSDGLLNKMYKELNLL